MLRADIKICLVVKGPLLTKSSTPGAHGLDAVVARNGDGIPYIPGTLIAGKVREALEQLSECCRCVKWFDGESPSWLGTASENSAPNSKRLLFSDLLLAQEEGGGVRTRIRIDPERGAVFRGAQLLIDDPFAIGEPFFFTGRLTLFIQDEKTMQSILHHVEAALKWTAQLGGYRSIGYGRVKKVTLEKPVKRSIRPPAASPENSPHLDILIRPEAPFCIARKPRTINNLFESDIVIPGAAVIGAIADTWKKLTDSPPDGSVAGIDDNDRKDLREHFNHIGITHAFPAGGGLARPVVHPLSLVRVDAKGCRSYYDVARLPGPCLIHGQAPAFAIDWKQSADVARDFGWPHLRRELRVRTAIDRNTLRSREAELFAYEMIIPDDNTWYGRINFNEKINGNTGRIGAQLSSLLEHGIAALGKTKSPADIKILPGGSVKPILSSHPESRDGIWIITLQTPALLCDPESLQPGFRRNTMKAYQDVWAGLSGGSLYLVRYFARQFLAGGKYLYSRFQHGPDENGNNRPYYPWLLTEAGSVFVLQAKHGKEGTALAHIQHWLTRGLELPQWATERYARKRNENETTSGNHWRTCPYIRQNGFGEIAVNLDVHWSHCPDQDEFELIDWIGKEDNS